MKKIFIILAAVFLSISFVNAQSKVVPIVEMKVGGLLGGVENGKYLDAKTTAGKLLAEQNYTLYLFDGKSESLTLKKPAAGDEIEACPDFFGIGPSAQGATNEEAEKIYKEAQIRSDKGGVALGTGFKWNPQPRAGKTIDVKNAEYQKLVGDFLSTKGIAKHRVELKQAVRVDLDGDGTEEVLLVASRYFPYTVKDGKKTFDEYSVVLLRKIVNGKPQTILVAGEIYPKNTGDYDGNFFELSSVLDLNGDGKMELVIYSSYYEGSAAQVFRIVGNRAVEVKTLYAGCGL